MALLDFLKRESGPSNKLPQANPAATTPSSSGKSISEISDSVSNKYSAGKNTTQSSAAKAAGVASPKVFKTGTMGGKAPTQTVKAGAISQVRQDVGFTLDKEVVEKTVKVVIGTFDGIVIQKVGKTTMSLTGDLELAKEMSQQAGLRVSELDMMGELSGVIAEKYGLLTGYAPEILLALLLGEWGVRCTMVMRKLNSLAEEQKRIIEKQKRQENVLTPSSNKDSNNG